MCSGTTDSTAGALGCSNAGGSLTNLTPGSYTVTENLPAAPITVTVPPATAPTVPTGYFNSDPGQWGASLINNAEVLTACLDAAGAASVTEVGAYAGDLTRFLLSWAQESGARVAAIDPSPQPELEALAQDRSELDLVRATSLNALGAVTNVSVTNAIRDGNRISLKM